MDPTPDCITHIKQFEGCRLAAYPDPATGGAPWTIGYGHVGPDVHKGTTWTQEYADARLVADVERFASGVSALLGDAPTRPHQFDALVAFAFNVGLGNLKNSTLLRKHKMGEYAEAAKQFCRWDKANGKVMKGLIRRRAAETALYLKK